MKFSFATTRFFLLSFTILHEHVSTATGDDERINKSKRIAFHDSLLRHHRRQQEEEIYATLIAGKGKSKYSDFPSEYPSLAPSERPTLPIQTPVSTTLSPTEPPTWKPSDASSSTTIPVASTTPAPVPAALPSLGPTFAQPPVREVITAAPNATTQPQNNMDRISGMLLNMLSPMSYDISSWQLDESSYQYQALVRTSEQEGVSEFSTAKVLQYWVLYCLYFSTNGPAGTSMKQAETATSATRQPNSFGWKNVDGWQNNNLDPCQDEWFGIVCDAQSQVTDILLQRNGLSGVLPYEIIFLAAVGNYHTEGTGNLRRLEVFANPDLTRSRTAWWESLVGLEVLNYKETNVGRNDQIPRLPYTLQEFDCSYASHAGSIVEESFAGLNVLILANLDGNEFQSSVPASLASLPNLQYLTVRNASLVGDLSYMQNMTSIVEHSVDDNPDLGGPLFSFLGSLSTLRSLSVSDCSLTGTVPEELAMPNLVQLWLHGNKLQGTIPTSFSTVEDLRILSLEDNLLSGTVPFDLCLSTYKDSSALSVDCNTPVDCTAFFPDCCSCCGRDGCGS